MDYIIAIMKSEDVEPLVEKYKDRFSSTPEATEFTPGYSKAFFSLKKTISLDDLLKESKILFATKGTYSLSAGSTSYYVLGARKEYFDEKIKPTVLNLKDEYSFKNNQVYPIKIIADDGNINLTILKSRNTTIPTEAYNTKRPIFVSGGFIQYDSTQDQLTVLGHFI